MRTIAKHIYRLLLRIKNASLLAFKRSLYSSISYFPEHANKRKSVLRRYYDQLKHTIKYGNPNAFYFLYGLDIKGMHNECDYIDYTQFMNTRNKLNNVNSPHSTVGILRNKFLFGIIANALDIATPNNIGIIEFGKLYLLKSKETVDLRNWLTTHSSNVFIKDISGECGDGVYHMITDGCNITVDNKNVSFDELLSLLGSHRYLVQTTITQHHKISAIHPKAVNTIRLETVYNRATNTIEVLPPLLRVGVGNNNVDNWAAGGLAIGIDVNSGTLNKHGFYKPGYGTKAIKHPTTGVVFEGYEIPYLKEAINVAKQFHSYLNDIHSIGWDIAITENGPCIIEGNDNWEVSLVQICSHGLQKEFKTLFK